MASSSTGNYWELSTSLAINAGVSIYRYVPRDYPQTQYLKMAGIHVDVSADLCVCVCVGLFVLAAHC